MKDEGRGIPPEVKARIFERFESHTLGTRHRGVGLGLSIVRSFVELHGGRIDLTSAPGAGTTVTCIFPNERHESPSDGRSAAACATTARRRIRTAATMVKGLARMRRGSPIAQPVGRSSWTTMQRPNVLARILADELRAGDLVTLSGGLGAGKTTLAARAHPHPCRQPDLEVPSPTFTLMQIYDGPARRSSMRISTASAAAQELVELGWEETTDNAITLVEWPERVADGLKSERLDIELEFAPGRHAGARRDAERLRRPSGRASSV